MSSAGSMFQEVLAIRKKAQGVDHPDYANVLDNLAKFYMNTGDYARAEPMFRQALKIEEKAVGRGHPNYARSLVGVAEFHRTMGDYVRAELVLHEALTIQKRAMGVNHPDYAQGLGLLAELYVEKGDYARAEPMHQQALAITKRALGVDHRQYGVFLHNVATLYLRKGDYARAEPMLREVLAVSKKALRVGDPFYATCLRNLADLYRIKGDYARADPILREAVAITQKTLGVDHPDYARALNHLALLYADEGDYARAEPMLREALAIPKRALGVEHRDYAQVLDNLAFVYKAMGDYARAEPMYREALAIRKKALGVDHPDYAECLNHLAALYWSKGDYARAEPLIVDALKITSSFTRDTSAVLGERQRLSMYRSQRGVLDFYLSLIRESGPKPAEIYRQVLDWKATADARRDDDRLARDEPELTSSLAKLTQASNHLATLAFRVSPPGQGEAWRRQLAKLREAKEDLEADVARRSAVYRKQKQVERLGPDEVAAALPAEVALVDFLEYHQIKPLHDGKRAFQIEHRLLAIVARRGRPVAIVPLGATQAIDGSVKAWRRARDTSQGGALQAAAAELGRRVWEPLRPHLVGADTVLIAPDGELTRLPFAALPGSRPGSYLIEDLAIGYVTSGRRAVEALTDPQGPPGRGLLAVGDVDFQADPGQPGPAARPPLGLSVVAQRGGFGPLPGTGPEARCARELFHATFADQPAELLMRAEPTEAAIKQRLDGGHWRIVHLGTHGFFESPARIAALRAAVSRDDPLALASKVGKPGEDDLDFALMPFLRSGVVLAGGGRDPGAALADASADAPAREDGILTAEEVQALDLRGTELVVLSACETGLGTLEMGQGVMGLAARVPGGRGPCGRRQPLEGR